MIAALFIILMVILFASRKKIDFSLRWIRTALGVYVLLLLLTVPVFYVVALPHAGDRAEMREHRTAFRDEQMEAYDSALSAGRIADYKYAAVAAQWDFEYQEKSLRLTAPPGEQSFSGGNPVYVEEKDSADGKLEVYVYTPQFPGRFTLTALPQVRLREDRLEIMPPVPKTVQMIRFHRDLIMEHLTDQRYFARNQDFIVGSEALYLRIPQGLQVEASQKEPFYINYVQR